MYSVGRDWFDWLVVTDSKASIKIVFFTGSGGSELLFLFCSSVSRFVLIQIFLGICPCILLVILHRYLDAVFYKTRKLHVRNTSYSAAEIPHSCFNYLFLQPFKPAFCTEDQYL